MVGIELTLRPTIYRTLNVRKAKYRKQHKTIILNFKVNLMPIMAEKQRKKYFYTKTKCNTEKNNTEKIDRFIGGNSH